MKTIQGLYSAPPQHCVGDGFPVRSLFSWQNLGERASPFLLLDHAGPQHFEPAARPSGVGAHPHRGFETVTIVYSGELEHRDSTGAGGRIGPGDVQWMTAGAGIVHEEMHSAEFTRAGGTLEMAQLWVNLPAAAKDTPAGYQSLTAEAIPAVDLPDGAGELRVIAGHYGDVAGPARTHTAMDVWDIRVADRGHVRLEPPAGWNAVLVVLAGAVDVNGAGVVRGDQGVAFDREAGDIEIAASADSRLLLLAGEPIDEPVVAQGPFVMNTQAEIRQAMADFRAGRFGGLGN